LTGSTAPPRARLYGLILLMTLLWAMNFVIGKVALREFPALLAGSMRTALAGVLVAPLYWWDSRRRSLPRWSRADLPRLLFLGLVGVALNQLFFLIGLGRTSVAHSAFLLAITPVLVLLLSAAFGHERISARKLAGMGVCIAGVLVLQVTGGEAGGVTVAGDLLTLLAAVFFSLFAVVGKGAATRHGPLTVSAFAYIGGGLMLAPVLVWESRRFAFAAVSAAAWASMVYMAVFPSLVCYLIYLYALKHLSPSRLSAFSYLQPLLASLLAIAVLAEPLTGSVLTGGALVLAGVFVAERG